MSKVKHTAGCNYQGYEFGAHYPDSVCIDGYLWDADSCDEPGGPLFSGGEYACPRCNTKEFISNALDEAADGGCGVSMTTPWCAAEQLELKIIKGLRENRSKTEESISAIPRGSTDDWPDREAVRQGRAAWNHTFERPIADVVRDALSKAEPRS